MDAQATAANRAMATLTGLMRRLSRTQAKLERLEAELNSRLDAVKGLYAGRMASLAHASCSTHTAVKQLCCRHRDVLLQSEKKSVRTPYGRVGFRFLPRQIALAEGLDDERACRALLQKGLEKFVRARLWPDRNAIRKAVGEAEVDVTLLAECGIRLRDGAESFFCILDGVHSGVAARS